MKQKCRVCLQDSEEVRSLFSESEEARSILHKIYLCSQTVLEPDKDLPDDICNTCLRELFIAYNFRTKCISIRDRFINSFRDQLEKTDAKLLDDVSTTLFCEDSLSSNIQDTGLQTNEFDSKSDLKQNEANINEVFQCHICSKVLKTMSSLSRHKEVMHTKRKNGGKVTGFGPSRRYHCTLCSYSTPYSQTLTNHIRRHEGDRPYVCECGKSFTQTSSLAAHQKSHNSKTYFTCAECGKQFKFAYALKTHCIVHENGRFPCHMCQKVLKHKRTLAAHLRRHYNICNYSCDQCGSAFVTSAELINHRKMHNRDKTLECHICCYKTNLKTYLIRHLKRHVGDRPHRCNLCTASFYTPNELKIHQRKHTHEKPFSCPSCTQRFAQSSNLNKHMKRSHGITYKWRDTKLKEKGLINFHPNVKSS